MARKNTSRPHRSLTEVRNGSTFGEGGCPGGRESTVPRNERNSAAAISQLSPQDYQETIDYLREDVKLLHEANETLTEKIEGLKMEKKADQLEIKHLKEKLNCLHYEKDALMDQTGELQKHIGMCQQENKELTNCLKLIGKGSKLELEAKQWAKTYGDLCTSSSAKLQNMEEKIAELKVALEQMQMTQAEKDNRKA